MTRDPKVYPDALRALDEALLPNVRGNGLAPARSDE